MDERDEDLEARAEGDLTAMILHVASAHRPVRLRVASVTASTPAVAAPKGGALKAVAASTRGSVPRQRRGA